VLDWATAIYEATRRGRCGGDPKIKAQLIKIARARGTSVPGVGWRWLPRDAAGDERRLAGLALSRRCDLWAEDDVGLRPVRDGCLDGDPALMGYAQQMIGDNQFSRPCTSG